MSIYALIKLSMHPFADLNSKYGLVDKQVVTMYFVNDNSGGYFADVPHNYIRMPNDNIKKLPLWALYPKFIGYSIENANKFKLGFYEESPIVYFDLMLVSNLSENELKILYGQDEWQSLFESNWGVSHKASEQQPYVNPIEFTLVLDANKKDYIFNSENNAIKIECDKQISKTILNRRCVAYKRIENTNIIIKYQFSSHLLADFGVIDKNINNLIDSFNIRKSSSNKYQSKIVP